MTDTRMPRAHAASPGGALSSASGRRVIEAHGCVVTLHRVDGPAARELFLLCQPFAEHKDPGAQAEAVYQAIGSVLQAEGGDFASVVCETRYLRNLPADLARVRDARQRLPGVGAAARPGAAITEIQQPPLDPRAHLLVSVQAVLPNGSPLRFEAVRTGAGHAGAEGPRAHGLRVHVGNEIRLYAGGLCGPGNNAHAQTTGMFELAADLLQQAGMEFGDVVRTWIHLRDIDRDYPALNQSRREFFERGGITRVPASTGIGGAPALADCDLCLGLYAVKGGRSVRRRAMSSPTLNEAMQYGADFVRGMNVAESNKVALHVSGTASIDEQGRTAHAGDLAAQAHRMLLNVGSLLAGQGAGFGDVVSAVTYVKRSGDAEALRDILRTGGFEGFPNAMVLAPICRSDLLCEVEALAVLPAESAPR